MTSSGPQGHAAHDGSPLQGLDTTVANPARMWNYWVGGKYVLRGGVKPQAT